MKAGILCVLLAVSSLACMGTMAPKNGTATSNYPNPFCACSDFNYEVAKDSAFIQVLVYNVMGQLVDTLVNEWQQKGHHSVDLRSHRDLPSGVYFCKVKVTREYLKKMVLVGAPETAEDSTKRVE